MALIIIFKSMKFIKKFFSKFTKFTKERLDLVNKQNKFSWQISCRSLWLRLKFFGKIKFKKIWLKIKKQPVLSFAMAFLLLIFIYLSFALSSVSASRLELLELKEDVNQNISCHEACRARRQNIREKIAESLLNDRRLLVDIKNYFALPLTETAFLEELLSIILLAFGSNNPPDFLIDYLANPGGAEKIKVIIVRDFLGEMSNSDLVDYYFLILSSLEGNELKKEAIKSLSRLADKAASFKQEQLDFILNLIFRNELSPSLNLDLVFLLSEYYPLFPEQTREVLVFIYEHNLDPVLKLSALNTLYQFGDFSADEIVVADEAWEKYWR